jgi:ATP-dependent DNA helicase RecG
MKAQGTLEKTEPETLESAPLTGLNRVGPRVAERLAKLGVSTVQDLLFHLPLRYQDRTRLLPLAALKTGGEALIQGEVVDASIGYGRRRSFKVWLNDGTGCVMLRFFHFGRNQTAAFKPGTAVRCFGEARMGPQSLEMVHPEYRILSGEDAPPLGEALTPIYPTTEGIQQASLRALTDQALGFLDDGGGGPRELLPEEIIRRFQLPDLAGALRYLHRPPLDASIAELQERSHPAFRRLAFEELVAHQVSLRRLRRSRRSADAPVLAGGGDLRGRLLASLSFELTGAQLRVVDEIAADLVQARPMLRLLQGDVGSGKTVVAALAALQAVESGHQAAIMAPTELLSEQHLRNLGGWLAPLGLVPVWLAGRHKGREREGLLHRIASGEARVVVGTHALFQRDVVFRELGLAIVDEQHRFGVHQRMKLREKGAAEGIVPHQLIMTATPIPRSLAMSIYADLDLSIIDESPPGRRPVATVAVPDARRGEVISRVRDACAGGRQAYWVCTLIEESEALQCQAAEDTAAALAASLPELRIGLVHGRLKAAERASVMDAFAAGELDLLVATTVIEVGVDVPNASLMIIENPERLGLAQLHQLRGRVGRGRVESHCLLLFHAPLSRQARDRIDILRRSSDGFEIARRDLEMRGPGEVLGTRQTGDVQFRVADPMRDESLLAAAQSTADLLLDRYPDRVGALVNRWLGRREEFGSV